MSDAGSGGARRAGERDGEPEEIGAEDFELEVDVGAPPEGNRAPVAGEPAGARALGALITTAIADAATRGAEARGGAEPGGATAGAPTSSATTPVDRSGPGDLPKDPHWVAPEVLQGAPRPWGERIAAWRETLFGANPGFWQAMLPLVILSVVLFTRFPTTNYIFDEQEALLANPYVNATQDLRFKDAIHRDFWGLPPDRSVGSYRPVPNFLWRSAWQISKQPFFHHFYNVLLHAANGALITVLALGLTRRRSLAWLAGALFVGCAVLTEAVSGIVGIADVLGGMGAILALLALRLPAWGMPFAVFAATLFGLFCKESALVCVPLVPAVALVVAPLTHPERPARLIRAVLAFIGAAAAFVLYVELRKRWFPSPLPQELAEALPEGAGRLKRLSHDFLVWFHQAPLPKDPLNNPLAEADTPHRIAGALRVYWRGLTQLVFPKTLSGDYSFPQEPIPDRIVFPESVLGAAMMTLPLLGALALWILAWSREAAARARAALIVTQTQEPRDSLADYGAAWASVVALPQSSLTSLTRTSLYGPVAPTARWVRPVGAALVGIAMGAAVLDFFVLRPRGQVIGWRGISLWLAAVPVGTLGMGLFAEGAQRVRRGWGQSVPVPLRIAGPALVAVGMMWIVVSYFPHSNIPVVLPTVRAERFWYFPAIGSALVLATLFAWLLEVAKSQVAQRVAIGFIALFIGFQAVQAYRHAMDYRDDVQFWEATKDAVPNSAKAHLNYSVMKGARGDLETRYRESSIALALAPKWPMAHVYTGDTLCRMHRAGEAWPHYQRGFELGPNELSLIALALQCLYDEGKLLENDEALRDLAEKNPGSWIAYLAVDTLENHEKNKGVDPKYRPRGYNEGPKDGE